MAAAAGPAFDDMGLTNGVTYYYVVTATDSRAESGPSNEAAARPEAPQALRLEVRYDPAVIHAECLLPGQQGYLGIGDRLLWGDAWRGHFSVDVINGRPANELKLDGRKIVVNTLRVGFDGDGSWRVFGLRHDFHPAAKVQTEDDITASVVLPADEP